MNRRRGSALLLSLWTVSVLAGLAIAQGTRTSLQLKWAGRMDEAQQARNLVWAAVEAANERLAADTETGWDAPAEPWGQTLPEPAFFSGGKIDWRITDEQDRIPLNQLTAEQAAQLPGFNLPRAERLVALRETGQPVAHFGELLLLEGFPKDELRKLSGLVTLYGSGPVNLNTASEAVLEQLGLSSSLAGQIAALRLGLDRKWGTADDLLFKDIAAIIPALEAQLGPLLAEDQTTMGELISSQRIGVASSWFHVEAEGWSGAHGIHLKTDAVLERSSAGRPLVRGWDEA